MFKLFCASALLATLTTATALADGSCCCNGAAPAAASAATTAPAPAMAQNQGVQSNRSFSYQPSTAAAAPMSVYRYSPRPIMGTYGFRGAASKALGNY